MSDALCMTRYQSGSVLRIECCISPLLRSGAPWALLCAAGLHGKQPVDVRFYRSFRSFREAESVLGEVIKSLRGQGYAESVGPPIWQLHMRAELRRAGIQRRA